uniref:Annexin n=1 Tax=Mesocestoides corti TaxID=53468 RepID=A0A5K3FA65_MESCO
MKTPDGNNFSSNFLPPMQQPIYSSPLIPQEPGVSQQQLTAVVNHLSQFIDQMRQRTVLEVRESLTQAIGHILKAIPKQQPPPPPNPVVQPAVEFPLGKGQLGQIFQQFNNYAMANSRILYEISSADMGKVIKGDLEDADDKYVLKIELEKNIQRPMLENKGSAAQSRGEKKTPGVVVHEKSESETEPQHRKETTSETKKGKKPQETPEHVYFETEEYVSEGTLKPATDFDCNADCHRLRKAMKGLGTDEKAIVDVLGRRSISQRLSIVRQFKTLFGMDLIDKLNDEISGNFFKVCRALCLEPDLFDAEQLREALKGVGTDEDCLIEILCCRTNGQIARIKETYKKAFNRDLEKDIIDDTSGHFQRLLVSILQGNRDESVKFERKKAREDAEALLEAGQKKYGTDESKFNEILISRSNAHLRAVFEEYEKISNKSVEDALKSEMSGDLLRGFLSIVRSIQNKPAFFAKALHRAMKGMGTDDSSLIRIIVTRCEIDMVQIKAAFKEAYKQTLGEFIRDDTSGDYRRIMLTLIGEENLANK